MTRDSPLTLKATGKSTKFSYHTMVEIFVGTGRKRYAIHKDLLVKNSDFFKAALSDGWQEAAQNAVNLPEAQIEIFTLFSDWLYHGTIEVTNPGWEMVLAEAFVFGDMLLSHAFRNAVIDAIIAFSHAENLIPGPGTINFIYQNTENSHIRKVMLDFTLWGAPDDFLTRGDFEPKFIFDLAHTLLKKRSNIGHGPAPSYNVYCARYHDHPNGEVRCDK